MAELALSLSRLFFQFPRLGGTGPLHLNVLWTVIQGVVVSTHVYLNN
jgi:hypothetical protein